MKGKRVNKNLIQEKRGVIEEKEGLKRKKETLIEMEGGVVKR